MLDWIIDLLKENFAIDARVLWDSLFLWRSFSLILLLIAILIILNRRKLLEFFQKDEIKNHDKDIFTRGDSILNEEQLDYALDDLYGGHRYYSDFSGDVDRLLTFFNKTSNAYYNKSIRKKLDTFYQSLKNLNNFLALNFFHYPPHQNSQPSQYCMYPNLNVDQEGDGSEEQMKKYHQFTQKLIVLISNIDNSYKAYRSTIKKILIL